MKTMRASGYGTRCVLTVCVAALFGCCVLLAGCVPRTMSNGFLPAGPMSATKKADFVQVCKAQEARPLGGRSRIGTGFLVFIPLVPYGHQQFTPERYMANNQGGLQYSFLEDVGRTVAKDLNAAGIAKSVAYVNSETAPPYPAPGSYALEVRLKEGIWHRYFTTYCLSFPGDLLWLIGAPVSYGNVQLAIEARLLDNNGNVLGTKKFAAKVGLTESAYGGFAFFRRLPTAYGSISESLRPFVAKLIEEHEAARKM